MGQQQAAPLALGPMHLIKRSHPSLQALLAHLMHAAASAVAPVALGAARCWLLQQCQQLLQPQPATAAGQLLPGWRWWLAVLPCLLAAAGQEVLLELLQQVLPQTAAGAGPAAVRMRHAAAGLTTALLQTPSTAPSTIELVRPPLSCPSPAQS